MAEEKSGESQSQSQSRKSKAPPATEKGVPSRPVPETTQYSVTVENKTGTATKIERVDSETGEKKTLTL